MKCLLFVLLIMTAATASAQQISWEDISTTTKASFRGLSIVDDNVAWVCGTEGTIGKTVDGGKTWRFVQLPGHEKTDFRTIYAFDSVNVILANAGSPTIVYRMKDGHNWNGVYHNTDSAAFIDGVDMWNDKEGIMYGDPIQGHLLILHTRDGGFHWEEMPKESEPKVDSGEASFAASGTAIRCLPNGKLVIATGGVESRLWISNDKGGHWEFVRAPIMKGKSSTGIFSFACKNDSCIIVGGNYKDEAAAGINAYGIYIASKYTWQVLRTYPRGYRECVEFVDKKTLITLGPSGADISNNNGISWQPLWDDEGYHVIRKSRRGNLVIAAGREGRIRVIWGKKDR